MDAVHASAGFFAAGFSSVAEAPCFCAVAEDFLFFAGADSSVAPVAGVNL